MCRRKVREQSELAGLDRQYTLSEIAIITRAGPARILGLKNKGHLGPGPTRISRSILPTRIRKSCSPARVSSSRRANIVEQGEIRDENLWQDAARRTRIRRDIETDIKRVV